MARRRTQPSPGGNAGRVALYIRVSALMGRSGDDFHSPDLQLDAMRRAAQTASLRETAVIEDIDVSGQTFSRAGIDKIRAMVENRQVDVIAVYDLSRLGRNLAEALTFVRWLREHDVAVMSTQERIDDTPEGQYMLGQFLGLAELYGAQIGRKWAQIIERRARLGRPHGNVPQGYTRTAERYIIDPRLGPAVTAMFTAYARGDQVADIATTFAAARGDPIAKSRIKVMLRNPFYAGRVVVHSSTGGVVDVPGLHEPLVDEVTWQRAQRRMAADRTTPPRHLAPAYSLTSLGICPHCDRNLQIWNSMEKGKGNPTRRLKCMRQAEVQACEGIGTPLYAPIEERVIAEVKAYAARLRGNPGDRAAQEAKAARAGLDADSIQRELDQTRKALGRLTQRWARGGIPDDAYEEALEQLTVDRDAQAAQLERAQELVEAPPPGEVVILVDQMFELWDDLSEADRNRGLKSVLRSFKVRRGAFWREPIEDRVHGFLFRW